MSCDLYVCYHLGVILKGTGRTSFSSHIRTVTFEDVPAAYKPGIPFEGKVISLINDHWELYPARHEEAFLSVSVGRPTFMVIGVSWPSRSVTQHYAEKKDLIPGFTRMLKITPPLILIGMK